MLWNVKHKEKIFENLLTQRFFEGAEIINLSIHLYFCAERKKKYETCPKIPRYSVFWSVLTYFFLT